MVGAFPEEVGCGVGSRGQRQKWDKCESIINKNNLKKTINK